MASHWAAQAPTSPDALTTATAIPCRRVPTYALIAVSITTNLSSKTLNGDHVSVTVSPHQVARHTISSTAARSGVAWFRSADHWSTMAVAHSAHRATMA